MNLEFGFSWPALGVFLLVMLPNFIYLRFPPVNRREQKEIFILNLLEQGSRALFPLLTVLLVSNQPIRWINPYLFLMLIMLLLYYVCWARYFTKGREYRLLSDSLWLIPIPMALFPVLFFIFEALWLRNTPALLVMIVFGISHCAGAVRMKQK